MVTAIQCVGAALVNADAVNFLVTFNKPVTGVVPGDFAVDGSMGGTVTAVSGSQGQFVVTVSGIPDGSGTLGLSVQDAGTIRDWFGTPLTDATVMLVDQQYAIDRQLYWDGSDGNAAAGGSGDWNGPNWHVGGPNGPLQQWCDGAQAFFGGVGGTISITAPVAASSLTFLSDGYLLQGDGNRDRAGASASLPEGEGGMTIDVSLGSATLDCPLGSGTISMTGDGSLRFGSGFTLAAGKRSRSTAAAWTWAGPRSPD